MPRHVVRRRADTARMETARVFANSSLHLLAAGFDSPPCHSISNDMNEKIPKEWRPADSAFECKTGRRRNRLTREDVRQLKPNRPRKFILPNLKALQSARATVTYVRQAEELPVYCKTCIYDSSITVIKITPPR